MDLQRFAEKPFDPTPHRLRQARREGRVSHSSELAAALALLAVALLLNTLAPAAIAQLGALMQALWRQPPPDDLAAALPRLATQWAMVLLSIGGPALLLALAVGAGASLLQTGFLFTPRPPDLGRLNPLAGLSRLFTTRSAVDLLKRLLKLIFIAWLGYGAIRDLLPRLPSLAAMPLPLAAAEYGRQAGGLLQRIALLLLAFGAADYAWQRWQYTQELRMNRDEVKREQREQETSPELRQRVRKKQRELAKRRMIQAVPRASLVITNPTHFAAALRYDPGQMPAPRLIAKGQDFLAVQIRQAAQRAGVPVVENPPLARALYSQVPLDAEIPPELYQAVAEVLAYLYRTRRLRAPAGK